MTASPLPSRLPAPHAGPRRLTITSPEDVLAAVPVILGFEPRDSVVMLTFGGVETFHARVDLPRPDRGRRTPRLKDVDTLVELLHEPARRHGVESVLFVFYSDDERAAHRMRRRLVDAFEASGIRIVETIRADGERWFVAGHHDGPHDGVAYASATHPFRVASIVEGEVVHDSREQLAALLDPSPAGVAAVNAARVGATAFDPGRIEREVAAAMGPAGRSAGRWFARFDDVQLAGLLLGLVSLDGRDAAWAGLTRSSAPQAVDLWVDAVQRSPADLVAAPAAVLAMTAWLAGHGALAWCAVDRSRAADPSNSLARLVDDLLTRAVPPSAWDAVWEAQPRDQ